LAEVGNHTFVRFGRENVAFRKDLLEGEVEVCSCKLCTTDMVDLNHARQLRFCSRFGDIE